MLNALNIDLGKWFTGKNLANAQEAMQLLNESIVLGYWASKASVKVPAALSKSNVTKKLSKASAELNTMKNTYGETRVDEAWDLVHNLYFGSFKNLADIDLAKLMGVVTTTEAKLVVAFGMEFVADFAPVVVAMEHLNKVSAANKKLALSDDKNPMGICSCCFRAQKVKPTGTMFAHGYERPGYGYIVGGCPGDAFKPYEVK